MYIGSQEQFAAVEIADRLHIILRDVDVGNGTPVADALASALALDLRMSGRDDGTAVLAALTRDQVIELAVELIYAVGHKDAKFTLPLGTEVKSTNPGDIRIGGEHWVLDASRPGLHAMETMRRDAHGANFELLRQHIRRMTRRLACRVIGLPSAAFIVDVDDRHLLQFPPFAGAGGVVLQRWANGTDAPRFAAALPAQIEEFAQSIVDDMRNLWKRRRDVAKRVEEVRTAVTPAAVEGGATVDLIAIDMSCQYADDRFDLYVQFDAVDEAMRKGAVLDFVPAQPGRALSDYCAPYGVWGRRSERDGLKAVGADGWIDDMAAAVLAAMPEGPAAALATLATDYEVTFELRTNSVPLFATLYWRNGVIEAELSISKKLDWVRTGRLELPGSSLPETMISAATGRRIDEFVELPFRCEIAIETVEAFDWGLRFQLASGKSMIELTTGRTWGHQTRN